MAGDERPILVTGAAGFIGSHVVEALLARGSRVVGIDNFDPFYDVEVKRRNVAACAAHRRASAYEFVEIDLCDALGMHFLFERVRPAGVVHLAAKAGVRPSIADPVGYARANVLGTSVLLREAEGALCSRVVLASSSSVYGNNKTAPFSEAHPVAEPISPYAATKRACELLAYTTFHLSGMPTACLRFFTVYGPRQRPDLAISLFLARVGAGEPIAMYGDGSSRRDYTYIDDIVAGVLAAYERVPALGYRVWNLGGSQPVRLSEMIATIGRVVGREPVVERRPMQPGDMERTWADLTRSRAELGFEPTTAFEEGVRRQWAWMGGGGGKGTGTRE